MNSTDYQAQLLQERIRDLEIRMLQLEDRVVFNPPQGSLAGLLSIAYAGKRTITLSFRTVADATDFHNYALEVAHRIKG